MLPQAPGIAIAQDLAVPSRVGSLLLVHGAGTGPGVFDGWAEQFPQIDVDAVDLHAGLVIGRASMRNYAAAVSCRANLLPPPRAICGWSMGGLAAMMAAETAGAERLVLLEPSAPAEVLQAPEDRPLEEGTFDPVDVYGLSRQPVSTRPESTLARAERQRGISVPSLPCPALVVYGDEFPDDRGRALAARYAADERAFPGLDHVGLVLDGRVPAAVADWLAS
jgi:pimeloyl-ACP methyl ester carboxylesterase